MHRIVTFALFGMLWCGLARGADSFDETRLVPSGSAARSAKASDTGKPREKRAATSWLTTLSSLGVVLALVYLTAKVLRKGLPAAQQSLPAEVLQVLGRRALDSRIGRISEALLATLDDTSAKLTVANTPIRDNSMSGLQ